MTKKVSLFSFCLLLLANCQVEPLEQIIDLNKLKNATISDAVELLGEIESREVHTGWPCETSECEKITFEGGKFEIIFKEGVPDQITILDIPDLTANNKAITALGLPPAKPSFKNPGIVIRWENYMGFFEINFSLDMIYIMLEPPDVAVQEK